MGTGMNNTTLKVLITAKRSLEYKEMSMVELKQHLYIGDFFQGEGDEDDIWYVEVSGHSLFSHLWVQH